MIQVNVYHNHPHLNFLFGEMANKHEPIYLIKNMSAKVFYIINLKTNKKYYQDKEQPQKKIPSICPDLSQCLLQFQGHCC